MVLTMKTQSLFKNLLMSDSIYFFFIITSYASIVYHDILKFNFNLYFLQKKYQCHINNST